MGPLPAFQVLVLAMAAAMAIEGLKPSHPFRLRMIFWVLFTLSAVIGIATNQIAAAWPAASTVMVWVGSSPITFFLALLAWLVWLQKPWLIGSPSSPPTRVAGAADDTDLEQRLARLEHNHGNHTEHLTKAQGGLEALAGSMDGMERRFDGALDGFKESAQSEYDSLRMYSAVLEGKITELKEAVEAHQGALLAVYHRERMLALAKGIDEKAMELAVPLAEGKVMTEEEWEKWKSDRLLWESSVSHWGQYASFYLGRDPMGEIKRINAEGLDENWNAKADQFPDPEGLRVYKTFRIQLRNWATISPVVHEKVRRKAFEGVDV